VEELHNYFAQLPPPNQSFLKRVQTFLLSFQLLHLIGEYNTFSALSHESSLVNDETILDKKISRLVDELFQLKKKKDI
jgi:hypothetical protein